MDAQEMIDLCKKHSLYTWSASDSVNPLPIERAEGIFMYEPNGKRYYDFNSQLMSVNIGHGHPKVLAAMKDQLDKLLYVFLHSWGSRGQRERHQGSA
jgi:taurine--2-oxoglutarate transaminase